MKVKVISLPYIFQVLYVLCFTRPRYQVSVYRTIAPLVLEFDVCFFLLMAAVNIQLDLCGFHHRFIYGQCIFFKSYDCRSEGIVPANTLKRLVRKRKYKNIFFTKIVFGSRIRTPTDNE